MEVMPGYKQTEAGILPEEWKPRGLLSVLSIASGQVDPRIEPFRSMILVAPDHIESSTGKLLAKRTAAEQRAISGKYLFSSGDIVYSKIRPYLKKAILADFSGLCSADMYPLRPVDGVIGGYILPVLLAHRFTKYAESVSVRSGMPKINRAELADFSIAIPPLREQQEVATALRDVDSLLDSLDLLIAKKRDLKQAAMQQLLTGQIRLPGFSGVWEVKRLGNVVEIKKGQLITSSSLQQGDIPVIAGGKQPAYFHASANRFDRTITISASGASAGYVALYNEPIFASDCSTIGESESYCLDFVYFQLLNAQQTIYKAQTGGAQPHIHSKDLNPILFAYPPHSEQTAIAKVLMEMNTELVGLEQQRNKTAALKQGMMQELLTGRTRLV